MRRSVVDEEVVHVEFLVPRGDVVFRRADTRAFAHGEGVLRLIGLSFDAAIIAHLNKAGPVLRLEHGVLAGKLRRNPLNRAL